MSSSSRWLSFWIVLSTGLAGCGASVKGGSSGGGGTIVTYTFTGPAPTAVATQIGSGAYAQATLTSGNLTISVPSGETNFSVAYLCPSPTINPYIYQEYINQASILDGTSFTRTCPPGPLLGGLATVQVNASAIPGAEGIYVTYQGGGPGDTLNFSGDLAVGTYDVPVYVTGAEGPYVALAARILRDQTIPGALNGGAPVVFTTADETVPQTITYNNLPNGYSLVTRQVIYYTAGGAQVSLDQNEAPLTQYLAMPSGAYQSGDYYHFTVGSYDAASGGSESIEEYASSPGPQSFTFPAPWSYAGPTPAALPTFNFAYAGFSGMPNVVEEAAIAWTQGQFTIQGAFAFDGITMTATANYQNGSTAVRIPDLSNVKGFLAPAASGTSVVWSATVDQGDPFLTSPPSGIMQSVSFSGSYTEP